MEETTRAALDIEDVKSQFENWRAMRKNQRSRIPDNLWTAAVNLTKKHSLNLVAKTLRLSYSDLKRKISGDSTLSPETVQHSFFELENTRPIMQPECIIELEDRSGARMKVCFHGTTNRELLDLAKSFWVNRP